MILFSGTICKYGFYEKIRFTVKRIFRIHMDSKINSAKLFFILVINENNATYNCTIN
jgi:hypothetical protein